MRVHLPLLALCLLPSGASLAIAQVSPSEPAPAIVRIDAGAQAAPAAPRAVPRTPEEQVIADLQAQGRARVAALVEATKAMPEGPALHELQRKVEALKRETRLAVLRAHLAHAEAKHDGTRAEDLRRLIARILNPPPPAVAPSSRPAPVAVEGGR